MEQKVLAGCRVLIAEDSLDIQRLVMHVLTRAGVEVVVVGNGRDAVFSALSAAATSPFDVILMDIQMPTLDGLAATRELRSLGYRRPIVALTSLASEAHRRKCLAAGCDEHIGLPGDPMRIVKVISRFVNCDSVQR